MGPHIVNLWSDTGTQLATAIPANETASGWQQIIFPSPVPVTVGRVYIASYHTASGSYSASPNYFNTARTRGPLTAPAMYGERRQWCLRLRRHKRLPD